MCGPAGIAAGVAEDVATGGMASVYGAVSGKPVGIAGNSGFFDKPSYQYTPGQTFTPAQMLQMSGGTILLSQIAAGADPKQAMANFLGVDVNQIDSLMKDNPTIQGTLNSLNQIQSNTTALNTVIGNLTKDFPNIMANSIQTYGKMADATIQPMLDQAMKSITASAAAAGGNISSGASALAAARAGEEAGLEKLNYATNLSTQDFQQQLQEAQALRGFQNTMLGKGVEQGFQTESAMLGANFDINARNTAGFNEANLAKYNEQNASRNALLGAAGTLGGFALAKGFSGGGAGTSPTTPPNTYQTSTGPSAETLG